MQRLNLFGGLSKVEIEALAGQLHDRVLRKRQLILDPESRGDRIYLVKTGAVRVYQISQEGRELTTAILRPGQLLGTAALAGISQQVFLPKRSRLRPVSATQQQTNFCGTFATTSSPGRREPGGASMAPPRTCRRAARGRCRPRPRPVPGRAPGQTQQPALVRPRGGRFRPPRVNDERLHVTCTSSNRSRYGVWSGGVRLMLAPPAAPGL